MSIPNLRIVPQEKDLGMGLTVRVIACGVYYLIWARLLPKWRGYQIRNTVIVLPDGAVSHNIIKVKNDQVEAWDAKQDPSGRSLNEQEYKA